MIWGSTSVCSKECRGGGRASCLRNATVNGANKWRKTLGDPQMKRGYRCFLCMHAVWVRKSPTRCGLETRWLRWICNYAGNYCKLGCALSLQSSIVSLTICEFVSHADLLNDFASKVFLSCYGVHNGHLPVCTLLSCWPSYNVSPRLLFWIYPFVAAFVVPFVIGFAFALCGNLVPFPSAEICGESVIASNLWPAVNL